MKSCIVLTEQFGQLNYLANICHHQFVNRYKIKPDDDCFFLQKSGFP